MNAPVTRICAACGGKLEFADDVEGVVCPQCGAEYVVRRRGTLVSLAPPARTQVEAQVGADRAADELTAAQPESDVQRLKTEVTRLRLERDIQQLKAELAQLRARSFQALWTWFIGTNLVVWFAARVDWTCSVAAVTILGLAFLAYMLDLRAKRREAQAVLERKQSELWPER